LEEKIAHNAKVRLNGRAHQNKYRDNEQAVKVADGWSPHKKCVSTSSIYIGLEWS
jgi:hypothetical protein